METLLSSNVCAKESAARYLVGAMIVAGVMAQLPGVPVWLALFSIYLTGTAIMAWDPLYAAMKGLRQRKPFSFDELFHRGSARPVS